MRHMCIEAVVEIVLSDVLCGGNPNTIVSHDVLEDVPKVADHVRLSYNKGMNRNAHDATTFIAFAP